MSAGTVGGCDVTLQTVLVQLLLNPVDLVCVILGLATILGVAWRVFKTIAG